MNYESTPLVDERFRKAAMVNAWPIVSPEFFPMLEIYHGDNSRGYAPPELYPMIIDTMDCMLSFLKKHSEKIISGQTAQASQKFKLDKADFALTFPVDGRTIIEGHR